MKIHLLAVGFPLFCTSLVVAQQSSNATIREVTQSTPAVAAPKETLDTFRAFFRGEFAQAESLSQYFREK
jgi:hypothetical protein